MSRFRSIAGTIATLVFVAGGGITAHAAPTPGQGPSSGGTTVTVDTPRVTPFTHTLISANQYNMMAIGSDRVTYAWGYNTNGQLGNNTTNAYSPVPVPVAAPDGVTFTHISVGTDHSLAIGSDQKTYAWGSDTYGQLGNDTTNASSPVPVPVAAPDGVTFTHISAGLFGSVAIGSDQKTYAWGYNADGQLGNNTTGGSSPVPVLVQTPAGVTFTRIASGAMFSLATGSDQKTYAWGSNFYGGLGNGTNTNSPVPVPVETPDDVTFTQIVTGDNHALAIGSDQKTYAWGVNAYGQLGDSTNASSTLPVVVNAPANVTFNQIGAGGYHSFALGSDNRAYAWGNNRYGQLGTNNTTNSNRPLPIEVPTGVTFEQITGARESSIALGSDQNTYTWGQNDRGQLGNNSTADSWVPMPILETPPVGVVTAISFDGVPGTNLTDNGDGTWSATTPAHDPGPVDVVISWTADGVSQPPVSLTKSFAYTSLPTITPPGDQRVAEGQSATFAVTTTGYPSPAVSWEVSSDGGTTWQVDSAQRIVASSAQEHTLTVVSDLSLNGHLFRATATNSEGTAVSPAATLEVLQNPAPAPQPTHTEPAHSDDNAAITAGKLATTGGSAPTLPWWGIGSLLLMGLGLLLHSFRTISRSNSSA